MRYLIGTLTKKRGCGIAAVDLEGDTLKIAWESPLLKEPNYLIKTRDGKRVFSVHETDMPDQEGFTGHVCELHVAQDGLTLVGAVPSHGDAPCYLTLSPDERYLYVANYATGSIAVFSVSDGLRPAHQVIARCGVGYLSTGRQKGPHMHQVAFLPDGTLAAADLGLDEVILYRQDAATGTLTQISTLSAPKGFGPRHIVPFHDARFYLCHEMGGAVSLCEKNADTWRITQTLPTLPADFQGDNYVGAIRSNAKKTRLIVSNRGYDTLVQYALDENGRMTFLRHMPCGMFPRDFIILKDGRILVANQGGNGPDLAQAHGTLTLLSPHGDVLCRRPLPAAVCILPL